MLKYSKNRILNFRCLTESDKIQIPSAISKYCAETGVETKFFAHKLALKIEFELPLIGSAFNPQNKSFKVSSEKTGKNLRVRFCYDQGSPYIVVKRNGKESIIETL